MNTRWRQRIKLYEKQPGLKTGDVTINQSGTNRFEVITLLKWDDSIQDYHGEDVAIIDRRATKPSIRFTKRKIHYRKKQIKNNNYFECSCLLS